MHVQALGHHATADGWPVRVCGAGPARHAALALTAVGSLPVRMAAMIRASAPPPRLTAVACCTYSMPQAAAGRVTLAYSARAENNRLKIIGCG